MSPAPAKEYPQQYLGASALAATVCYPLWRAAAMGQSGFALPASSPLQVAGRPVPAVMAPYLYGFLPPYKGMLATVLGMTWARAGIFWLSDTGHDVLLQHGYGTTTATVAPPLVVGAAVQVLNQPIVRSTVTLQDPQYNLPNARASLRQIYATHGVAGLWHGTTAGVLKTVPKYVTAIAVKDFMEDVLPQPDESSPHAPSERLQRSAMKSAAAGIAGAALTNPLDVIRNEQFKTHLGLRATVQSLWQEMGVSFFVRGLGKNLVAVAMPIGLTIFLTDVFIGLSQSKQHPYNDFQQQQQQYPVADSASDAHNNNPKESVIAMSGSSSATAKADS